MGIDAGGAGSVARSAMDATPQRSRMPKTQKRHRKITEKCSSGAPSAYPVSVRQSALAARHLQKRFGARTVVKDISLEVKSGEIVGLLGPNGAGKTTSFYMMVGLIP